MMDDARGNWEVLRTMNIAFSNSFTHASRADALRVARFVTLGLALAAPRIASAQEHEEAGGVHAGTASEKHEHEYRFHVNAMGTVLAGFTEQGTTGLYGGGAEFEVVVIPRWLEVTLVVRGLAAEGGAAMPIDLLAKMPFHVNHWFHPFVGIGPAVVPVFLPEGASVGFGFAAVAGADFWITPRFGVFAEVNYNLVYNRAIANEVGGSVGPIVSF
jgi:hypothetical protein